MLCLDGRNRKMIVCSTHFLWVLFICLLYKSSFLGIANLQKKPYLCTRNSDDAE